jgi:hypothetical protein
VREVWRGVVSCVERLKTFVHGVHKELLVEFNHLRRQIEETVFFYLCNILDIYVL